MQHSQQHSIGRSSAPPLGVTPQHPLGDYCPERLKSLWFQMTFGEREKAFGTAKDAAALVALNTKSIYRLHFEDRIPSIKVGARLYIHLPSLREWVLANDGWRPARGRHRPERSEAGLYTCAASGRQVKREVVQ